MADTVISDAVAFPQDEGIGSIVDGNESWDSAGLLMSLAQCSYFGSFRRSGLIFSSHDGGNNTIDITPGVAFLSFEGETLSVQSDTGGSIPPNYDTTLPTSPSNAVVVPSTVVDVPVQDATLSDVWLAYATDGAVSGVSVGDIYIRSDDTGSVTQPPHPSLKLGSSNPDTPANDSITGPQEPPSPASGTVWPDYSGDNVEYHFYNLATGQWETLIARGPNVPEYPVEGTIWRDTANSVLKQYDGSSFNNIVPDKSGVPNQPTTDTPEVMSTGSYSDNDTGTGVSGNASAGNSSERITVDTNIAFEGQYEFYYDVRCYLTTSSSNTEIDEVEWKDSDGVSYSVSDNGGLTENSYFLLSNFGNVGAFESVESISFVIDNFDPGTTESGTLLEFQPVAAGVKPHKHPINQ